MNFIYYFVTSSKCWEARFHENFFNAGGGFIHGLIAALVIGAIFACIFYFCCCNSKTSAKMATIGVWALFLAIAGVASYFYADMIVIGDSSAKDNKSIFRTYSFYKANDDFFINESKKPTSSPSYISELTAKKTEIKSNLDKGGDVRQEYDFTTAAWSLVFFFITSIIIKRFTRNGKHVPFLKP